MEMEGTPDARTGIGREMQREGQKGAVHARAAGEQLLSAYVYFGLGSFGPISALELLSDDSSTSPQHCVVSWCLHQQLPASKVEA